jgi:hypothetical protein
VAFVQIHEPVTGELLSTRGSPLRLEVRTSREEPERVRAHPPFEEILLLGPEEAQRDVCIVAQQVDRSLGGDDLDANGRMALVERQQFRGQPLDRESLARRDAHPTRGRSTAPGLELDGNGLLLHPLHPREQSLAGCRGRETFRRACEEMRPELGLER